ncbi:unnamed protein product (macronuclear) [Paramecium tetraurelia]|uniref:Pecanex C-terminal domain-containing protein n=1 Tax=Paramecium tetraurelia TaxID=5888 RepID=A0DMJ9_PARTE|nr:uncharacterized protein GSPATT00018484001 [Paramecium tetraurelia]CAK84266.1 unnamed protein product [Paramecium tetraurelia]|eukprot:XP_001451663.1 hypothetical protein (macronuclear) [Paramecium tetraurelia strain d4-2]
MNQTATVLTIQKRKHLLYACLASLFGGYQLYLPTKAIHPKEQVIIQLAAVIQPYLIAKFLDNYIVVLIVPAFINLQLQFIMNYFTANEHRKSGKQVGMQIGMLFFQTLVTASAIKYEGTVIDAVVFFFLFPREQNVELGFTQLELYSRSSYALLFLTLILILTHANRMIIANIIRYIYYFTPILIWIGLFGQFSQFLEYVCEQFNFLMGSSYQSSQKRTYLTVLLNVALIAICLGLSYIDEQRIAIIISGCLINIKMFNIFGSINQDQKQLYKQQNLDRLYLFYNLLSSILNVISTILCGTLASSYYKELYYAIIVLFTIYMIIQFQFQQYVKYYKIFYAAIEYACISMMDYEFEGIFAQRLLECTTIIRLYSLIHSNPTYLFFEQLVCFIVSFTTSYSMAYCQLIGFLVQIALRFGIRTKSRFVIWIIANYKMLTVKKQKVEGAALITSLQLLMCPITFFIMLISSILDSPYMPLLGLPIFYFSSLRPFRNTIHIQKHLSNSAEGQIYNFYLSKSYNKLLGSQPLWSHYLIRIGKYLGVVQVLEYQGGYAVIQFKGLESQDTTSCHSIEAREVDRLVNAQDCGSYFGSALTLQNQFSVPGYEENQLTLTGIIEATEFVSGFKTIYLKMLCYQAQKLTETNKKSIIELSKRFEGPEHPFPNQFADLIELKTNFLSFMSEDLEQDEGMKQQNTQHSKKQLQSNRDEITSMLEELDDDNYLQNQNLHQYQNKNFNHQQNINLSGGFYNHIQRTILYIYQVSLRDLDFNFEGRINQIVLFDLFKNSNSLFEQHQMKGVDKILSEIATLAIRSALKISLDFYSIEQHLRIEDTQLLQELEGMKECFVGMGSDEGWQKAMIQNFLLWSLGYDASQNQLKVYRQSYTNINCQVFRFDSEVVRGIEANLQMEMLFATNDDDERRYSIQTHEQFFRNIIIEGSEFPLGYAPFYSGPVVISLR